MDFIEEWVWFFQFEGKEIVKDLLKVIYNPSKTAFFGFRELLNMDKETLNNNDKNILKEWELYFKALQEYRIDDLTRLYKILFYLRMHHSTFYIPASHNKLSIIKQIVNDWKYYKHIDYDNIKLAEYIYAWGHYLIDIPFDLVKFLNNNNIDLYLDDIP